MNPIPYGKQQITEHDIEEVVKVLKSDNLTQGPKISEFEKKFAKYIDSKHAVAVANGTAALHISTLTLNIKPGDKVITTPITFVASANCVLYAGGEIVFADIDPETYLIDINKVEDILKKEKNIKGIIPVDFAGYPVNVEELKHIADKYNLWIIEDACHAPGGYFIDSNNEKQRCGNGEFSDLTVFSFHPVKHIACGEGGMITTNNEKLYKKLLNLRTHGIQQDKALWNENHGIWYYEMQELGFNYRITDIQSALGISQLKRAYKGLRKRQMIAKEYDRAFKNCLNIETPYRDKNVYHAFHLYIIQISKRDDLQKYLRKKGIFAQVHYIPIHLQHYYKKRGWKKGDFPIAEAYYNKCLSLPMYPGLTNEEQDFVINAMEFFYD